MSATVLIGMPGCGKTSVAEAYNKKYGKKIYDTDAIIVSRYGNITDIFKNYGEEYFRGLETQVLKEVISYGDDSVISVGGGCAMREENVKLMREGGCVIAYLRCKPQTLAERLKNDTTRPLLQGDIKGNIEKLYALREKIYEGVADKIIDTDLLTPEQVLENILAK